MENKHRTLKARRNSDLRYPSIDYTPIIDATSKNQLICITGENGAGKTYALHIILQQICKDISQHNTYLFSTQSDGKARKGHVAGTVTSEHDLLLNTATANFFRSHGQNLGNDLVDFMLASKAPVILLDEPETALSLNSKEQLLKCFMMEKTQRPIIMASNCPIFICASDLIFHIDDKGLRVKGVEYKDALREGTKALLNKYL